MKSISFKLFKYFTLFAVIILSVLWLLQTVFLQSFYNIMQKNHIKKIAQEIYNSEENIENIIDSVSANNPMLILLTDKEGNIIYSADEYSLSYKNSPYDHQDHGVYNNPYKIEETKNYQDLSYRRLPEHYNDFLEKLGKNESVCYTISHNGESSSLVYGRKMPDDNILYINTSIEAVDSAVSILRLQLFAVTILALITGLAIAVFISKKFSEPIYRLSEQSLKMAEGSFDIDFEHGFCTETDRLADSLEYAAKKIAETDKLRRELLANVSHDLRTPLTIIKGYAELIKDLDGGENTREDTEVIIKEADRLTLLVNDILDFSKLQSENVTLNFEKINISMIAENISNQFLAICSEKNIKIIKETEKDIYVNADKGRIQQVIYNLMSNAISHTQEGGTIRISVYAKDDTVRTEIYNTGEGISPKDLPHIWDRYFTSEKRNTKGLGLAIVKEILTAHNAAFGADSKEGENTVFWFELNKT